jgi:hypothetical protein
VVLSTTTLFEKCQTTNVLIVGDLFSNAMS